jgi:serine/threonine protein kinase
MGRLAYLKTLREPVYTKLCLVKDIDRGSYCVEKSLIVSIDFQKQLFDHEIKIHSQLDHRYIISFIEQASDRRFLLEYASSGNLQHIIDSTYDEKIRRKLSINFLKGLQYLHQQGFVHNDIKPTNILVTRENRAKLADFAFCGKLGEVNFKNIPSYFVLGTEHFKPPQELSSYKNKISNDIYAVGKVLYMLFTISSDKKFVHLNSLADPGIRDIVHHCLTGSLQSLTPIIETLTRS